MLGDVSIEQTQYMYSFNSKRDAFFITYTIANNEDFEDIKTDNNFDVAQKEISKILDKHNLVGKTLNFGVKNNYYVYDENNRIKVLKNNYEYLEIIGADEEMLNKIAKDNYFNIYSTIYSEKFSFKNNSIMFVSAIIGTFKSCVNVATMSSLRVSSSF